MTQEQRTAPRSFWQGASLSVDSVRKRMATRASRRIALYTFFTYEVICLTFLQKLAIPLNFSQLGVQLDVGSVQAALPLTYLGMIALFIFVPPKLDLNRLVLLVAFLFFAILSTLLLPVTYSVNSILLLITIYVPFVFIIEVGDATYRRMIEIYLYVMVFFGAVVMAQHFIQVFWSWRLWPDLDRLIPDNFKFQGFGYTQAVSYGSRFMKPNAIFFLEVSYVSQWTAVAFALDLVYFRKLWRLAFYAVVMISTFAGTGLLLLAICAPVLLTRLSRKSLLAVAVIFVVGLGVAFQINWYQQVHHRFTEYRQTGASANHRFVEPLDVLGEFAHHPNAIFEGEGPGSAASGHNEFWWVVTKVSYEYGFLTALSFFAFLMYALFWNAPSQRIAFLLVIFFNFMGGFIIPIYPLLVFLIGVLFRVRGPKAAA
jgi:hypothetical protein